MMFFIIKQIPMTESDPFHGIVTCLPSAMFMVLLRKT